MDMLNSTDIWTYRATIATTDDLEGFDVEAEDGSIGDVDEATTEVGSAGIVVDTGPWIFGKKVVLPAGTIEQVDLESRKVFVGLTKDQIKASPEYDADRYDDAYRSELGTYYADSM
jgi:hypothetical protein